MFKNLVLVITSLFFINGCVLGVSKLDVEYPYKDNFYNKDKTDSKIISQTLKDNNVEIIAEWVGNAKPLETSKNALGLIDRYVIPYTRSTSVVNLKIINKSVKYLNLKTENINLKVFPENKVLYPLDLNYFKNKWPSSTIVTSDMLIDQSLAISEVIRTIFKNRIIEPNDTYEGYLAFPKISEDSKELELTTKINVENDEFYLTFKFIKK